MTRDLHELLASRPYVLGDGAMGTMLQSAGLEPGIAPEVWNLEHPADVEAILGGYVEAGACYVTTNTFGGTAPRLALHGLEDRVEELSRIGAELARRVANRFDDVLVAGDIGPTGELYFPLGTLTEEEAVEVFAAQIRGLVAGGCDFILLETTSALEEVRAAVRAAQETAPGMPIAAAMSFDTNLRTMMGVTPAQAVAEVSAMGVRVIGANCGRGPDEMTQIMEQMAAARPDDVYLLSQSNAGLPILHGDEWRYDGTPEVMAAWACRMRDLGVNVIGACCGSTPEHIAAIAAAVSAPR
jgi:5-methyltetrahydrofolate--homocysteine methyltransferase